MADEQEYPGTELTDQQAGELRDVAVHVISSFILREEFTKDTFDGALKQAEFALKVLDFVTG